MSLFGYINAKSGLNVRCCLYYGEQVSVEEAGFVGLRVFFCL